MSYQYVRGADRLVKRLNRLGGKYKRAAIRNATRVANKQLLSAVKPKLPKRTGKLQRSIKVRAIERSRKWIGTKTSITAPGGDEFYAFFLEYGWFPARHTGKTTSLPTQFKAQHVGKDGKVRERVYRSDKIGNARRRKVRRWNRQYAKAGKGDYVSDSQYQGQRVPGRFFITGEARRRRLQLRRTTYREILNVLRKNGL